MGGQDEDRGYRKKSREKMRRQEVNVKVNLPLSTEPSICVI